MVSVKAFETVTLLNYIYTRICNGRVFFFFICTLIITKENVFCVILFCCKNLECKTGFNLIVLSLTAQKNVFFSPSCETLRLVKVITPSLKNSWPGKHCQPNLFEQHQQRWPLNSRAHTALAMLQTVFNRKSDDPALFSLSSSIKK